MVKTGSFVLGVTCGFAMCAWLTEAQRRQVVRPLHRAATLVTESSAAQKIGGTVHDAAGAVADTAATKIDDLAHALPGMSNGHAATTSPN